MPKTPGQLFAEQVFGGLQRGIESLPGSVRQNRLDERLRQRENFGMLLDVRRVTQEFEAQELRKARFEESLLQTDAIERANTLLGNAVSTGRIQEAIGPLSEAFGQAGVNPATSLGIFQKLQPQKEKEAETFSERFVQMTPEEQTVQLDALKKIASAKRKGEIAGLNMNQSRVLTGQIDNAIRGEKKLTDSRVNVLKKAIENKRFDRGKDTSPDQEEQEMIQRLQNLEDYLKFLNTGAAKDSVINEFLSTIDVIEERTK